MERNLPHIEADATPTRSQAQTCWGNTPRIAESKRCPQKVPPQKVPKRCRAHRSSVLRSSAATGPGRASPYGLPPPGSRACAGPPASPSPSPSPDAWRAPPRCPSPGARTARRPARSGALSPARPPAPCPCRRGPRSQRRGGSLLAGAAHPPRTSTSHVDVVPAPRPWRSSRFRQGPRSPTRVTGRGATRGDPPAQPRSTPRRERPQRPHVRRACAPPGAPEQPQHLVSVDDRIRARLQDLPMAAPPVVGRVLHQAGDHRVEVDVDKQLVEIPLILHQLGPIPALPQRPEHPSRSRYPGLPPPVETPDSCARHLSRHLSGTFQAPFGTFPRRGCHRRQPCLHHREFARHPAQVRRSTRLGGSPAQADSRWRRARPGSRRERRWT